MYGQQPHTMQLQMIRRAALSSSLTRKTHAWFFQGRGKTPTPHPAEVGLSAELCSAP